MEPVLHWVGGWWQEPTQGKEDACGFTENDIHYFGNYLLTSWGGMITYNVMKLWG